MKLVKIRFTGWRDKPGTPRTSDLQTKLDAWTGREHVLRGAALRVRQQQATADSEALRKEFTAITTELTKINAARQPLLSVEDAARNIDTGEARGHKKVGTFGYQVFDEAGTEVTRIVDEDGHDLPAEAVYSYEVVDDKPPLPEWASIRTVRT